MWCFLYVGNAYIFVGFVGVVMRIYLWDTSVTQSWQGRISNKLRQVTT